MGCTPGSQRYHTSVISRCSALNSCTRHQYNMRTILRGVVHHHEFILFFRQVSSMAEQPFCKRQVVGSTPPPGSTVRHSVYRVRASWLPAPVKSGLHGGQSLRQIKSVGGISSLNAFVLAQPPDAKQWQSSGILPQNYSACTFGQVTAHPCRIQSRLYGSLKTQHPA